MKNTVFKLSEPFDLSHYKNTRFMYNPTIKEIILGSEHDTVENGSHAQMYYDAKQNTNTGYDDYNIKGWIGFGGRKYQNGVIHFAPNIRPDQYEKIDQAFTLIEKLKKHGFNDNTWIRGLVRFDEFKIKDMYDKVANWQDDVKPYTEQVKDFVNCSFVKDKVYKLAEGVYTSDKLKAQYHNSDLKPYFLLIDSPFYSNGKLTESFDNLSKKGFNGIIQGKTYRVFNEAQQVKEADAQKDADVRDKVDNAFKVLTNTIKKVPQFGKIMGSKHGFGYFANISQCVDMIYPMSNKKLYLLICCDNDSEQGSFQKFDDFGLIRLNVLSENVAKLLANGLEAPKSKQNKLIKEYIYPALMNNENTFKHEFIHSLDHYRLKDYKGRKKAQQNISNTEYLNDPLEFNAWFQSNIQEFDGIQTLEKEFGKDWKLFYSYVLDCLPFVKEYNEKYRRKFDVRLWKYWNEFIKEKKQVNEALKNEGGYFITNKPADIINLCINKPKEYRIVYDSNINLYMICDANEGIHQEMLEKAYRSGLYYKMDNFIEQLGAFQNYIETGQTGGWDADDNEIDQYLFYIIFDPKNNWQLGDDEYDSVKEFNFGKFFTRGCELEETPLYNEALKHNQLNEAYVKGERGNAYYTKSDDVFLSLVKSIFISKNLPVRVAYDISKHLYMFGNAFDYIHTDLIKTIKYQSNEYDESDDVQSHCALFQIVPTDEVKKYTMSDGYNSGWILPLDNMYVISRNKEHNATMEVPAFEEHKWEWTGIEYYEYKKGQEQDKVVNESAELNDNFWKWFKGSKIVDANGNPLVCYHGTRHKFDTFDFTRIGRNFGGYNAYKGGMCFTTDENNAIGWGRHDFTGEEHSFSMPVYLSIKNPYEYSPYKSDKQYKEVKPDFNKLIKQGYDGIIDYTNADSLDIVAFYPNQIKSVNNNGNWSDTSDNINEMIEEGVNDNYLYHALWKKQFIRCKKDGKLYSHTAYENNGNHTQHRTIKGISMSRNFRVCMKFMENQIREMTDEWDIDPQSYFVMRDTGNDGTTHYIDKGSDLSYVVLVFDRNKLKQNHKIIPHSYLAGGMRDSFGDEQEELVVGDIPNFMNYVVDVVEFNNNVNSKTLKSRKDLHEGVEPKLNDNFWKWFGNSKMKNKNGEPIVFYHTTYSDISVFEPVDYVKGRFVPSEKGIDHYHFSKYKDWTDNFAKDEFNNKEYKNKKTYEVFLKIEKPLVILPVKRTVEDWVKYLNDKNINISIEEILHISTFGNDFDNEKKYRIPPEIKKNKEKKAEWLKNAIEQNKQWYANRECEFWKIIRNSNKVLSSYCKKAGYDGILMRDTKRGDARNLTVIVFDSNQIKSINNNGNWSLTSNNINEAVAPKLNDNFWKWFGNSKVVDSQGNPLVVYHGTDAGNFDTFNMSDNWLKGIKCAYFSSDYDTAASYCMSGYPSSFYLKIENPYILDAKNDKYDSPNRYVEEALKNAYNGGYDGAIVMNIKDDAYQEYEEGVEFPYSTTYIVFNPNQIKSINNNGNWSLSSDNINEVKEPNLNQNFWSWFGDSVCVDDTGAPKILYHGTSSDFKEFKTDLIFTCDDPNVASEYGSLGAMPVFVKIRKPFIVDAFNQSFDEIYNAEGFKKKYKDLTDEDIEKLYKAYEYFESLEDAKQYYEESKKYNPDDYINLARAYGQKPHSTNDWAKYAKSKGYDGCIIKNVQDTVDISNKTVNEYIVWNSNQVKSIENDGSWSEKDDIYESVKPQYVYHATWKKNYEDIIKQNKIIGQPNSVIVYGKKGKEREIIDGVSLSRSKEVCKKLMNYRILNNYSDIENRERLLFYSGDGSEYYATKDNLTYYILVLDYDKLKQDNKVIPHSYMQKGRNGDYGDEAEELIIGDLNNLKKYLVNVEEYKYNPLTESWWSGGVNWQNDREGLGGVGATMDCKLFLTMFPDQFLNLCPSFSYGDDKFFMDYVASRKPMGIPFLWCEVDRKNKTLKVLDHEGRHRVQAIRDYALSKGKSQPDIPVAIVYNKDKYSLPTDLTELRKEWKIVSQNGSRTYNIGSFGAYSDLSDNRVGIDNLYESAFNYGILYHGTNNTFDNFSKDYQNGGYLGNGFYFTMSKNMARSYGSNIISAKLKYKNSFLFDSDILDEKAIIKMLSTIPNWDKNTIETNKNIYLKQIKDNAIYDANKDLFSYIDFYKGDSTKVLKELGYDSIDNIERDSEFVVFEPKQIEIVKDKINESAELNDNFWKWFGNSVTVDENGNPLIFYHGTKQQGIKNFKAKYSDGLIFFAYNEEFAKQWASHAPLTPEQEEKTRDFQSSDDLANYRKEVMARYKRDYGDNWADDDDIRKAAKWEIKEYEKQKYKQMGIEENVMPVYIRATKIFNPARDYELVLDKIAEHFDMPLKPMFDKEVAEAEKKFNKIHDVLMKWLTDHRDWIDDPILDKEVKKRENMLDNAFKELEAVRAKNKSIQDHLKRIQKGAWIYFENPETINKIWELGYDAIELAEHDGEISTLAVREGTNQIKSIFNDGSWSDKTNIFEAGYQGYII